MDNERIIKDIKKLTKRKYLTLFDDHYSNERIAENVKKCIKDNDNLLPLEDTIISSLNQSFNIRFGSSLEEILKGTINLTGTYSLVNELNIPKEKTKKPLFKKVKDLNAYTNNTICGGKPTRFFISDQNLKLINEYVDNCTKVNADKTKLDENFNSLIEEIKSNIKKEMKNQKECSFSEFDIDVDLLFLEESKKKSIKKYYYIEVKTADNHDSSKTKDMYKKIIKTFVCLLYQLYFNNNNDDFEIEPGILFWRGIKNQSNILPAKYIHDRKNFFGIPLEKISSTICDIANSKEIKQHMTERKQYISDYLNSELK